VFVVCEHWIGNCYIMYSYHAVCALATFTA